MTAEYTYKCRLCKKEHSQATGGWDNDILGAEMFIATHGDSPVFNEGKIYKIEPVSYHLCKDGSFGVCDFVGIKKIK